MKFKKDIVYCPYGNISYHMLNPFTIQTQRLINSNEITKHINRNNLNRTKTAKTRPKYCNPKDLENIQDREYYQSDLQDLKDRMRELTLQINAIIGDHDSLSKAVLYELQSELSSLQREYSNKTQEFERSRILRRDEQENLRRNYFNNLDNNQPCSNLLSTAYQEVAPDYYLNPSKIQPTPRSNFYSSSKKIEDNRSDFEIKFDNFKNDVKKKSTINDLDNIRSSINDDKKFETLIKELQKLPNLYKGATLSGNAFNRIVQDIKQYYNDPESELKFQNISEQIIKNVENKCNQSIVQAAK